MEKRRRFIIVLFLAVTVALQAGLPAKAALVVDGSDASFQSHVLAELELMRSGQRGVVAQSLADRLNRSLATTTIRPVTSDESTWHPNDPKGVRSYVRPIDTLIRGAGRSKPTSAILFLHPDRINPDLSLFRTGTFVYELAMAADLNDGTYPEDFRQREKRAVFYRNAWCDAVGCALLTVSDRVPTPEYQKAKAAGLITAANAPLFPILSITPRPSVPSRPPRRTEIRPGSSVSLRPGDMVPGDAFFGGFLGTRNFLIVDAVDASGVRLHFGQAAADGFSTKEAVLPSGRPLTLEVTAWGVDLVPLEALVIPDSERSGADASAQEVFETQWRRAKGESVPLSSATPAPSPGP